MTTYTLALHRPSGMLLASAPDGAVLDIPDEFDAADVKLESGLTLTNHTRDGDEVVYSGTALGWITDCDDDSYDYAVRRAV